MTVFNKGLAEANYLVTREKGYTKKDIQHEMDISVKTYGDGELWSKWFINKANEIRKKRKK